MSTRLFTHFALTGPAPSAIPFVDGNYQITHGAMLDDDNQFSEEKLYTALDYWWPFLLPRVQDDRVQFVIDLELTPDDDVTFLHYRRCAATVRLWGEMRGVPVNLWAYLWCANAPINASMENIWGDVCRVVDGLVVPIHREEPANDAEYREQVLPSRTVTPRSTDRRRQIM